MMKRVEQDRLMFHPLSCGLNAMGLLPVGFIAFARIIKCSFPDGFLDAFPHFCKFFY